MRVTRGRRRRRHTPRSRTIRVKELTRREIASGAILNPPIDVDRPRTRGECVAAPRPCPFVGCKHHLYLDVTPSGSIKLNFPTLEPWELEETCSLDVADRGGQTLELVGQLMNVTRERTRQIETRALTGPLFAELRKEAKAA